MSALTVSITSVVQLAPFVPLVQLVTFVTFVTITGGIEGSYDPGGLLVAGVIPQLNSEIVVVVLVVV